MCEPKVPRSLAPGRLLTLIDADEALKVLQAGETSQGLSVTEQNISARIMPQLTWSNQGENRVW